MKLPRFITERDEPAISLLEARMRDVYADKGAYRPFSEESSQPELWQLVLAEARKQAAAGPCRLLEIGSGRSGFHAALHASGLRASGRVHYTAHDVTAANAEFLREKADAVAIGPVDALRGPFDIIFHSFVLEHIVRPQSFFRKILGELPPGGVHVFSCPRYDVPGIMPPSLTHTGIAGRLRYLCFNLQRLVLRHPRFPLVEDPAILHRPYFRDADAIHCVAVRDVVWLHRGQARITKFTIPAYTVRDRAVKRLMGLNLFIRKT